MAGIEPGTKTAAPAINPQKSEIYAEGCYPCKFDLICKQSGRFNPAVTVPIEIRDINGQPKTIMKLGRCTHGGGVGCAIWRRLTAQEIGWEKPLPNRNFPFMRQKEACA